MARAAASTVARASGRDRRGIMVFPVGGAPVEHTVVHALPGRVRLRVPRLRADQDFASRVETLLRAEAGVVAVRMEPACASVAVVFTPGAVGLREIGARLTDAAGAGPRTPGAAPARSDRGGPGLGALLGGAAALGAALIGAPAVLTAGLLAFGSVPIVVRAARAAFAEHRVSVDVLDATAIGVLALRGDVATAALTAALIAGGEYIRALTARRSRRALVGLLASTGAYAWIVRGRRPERLPAAALQTGDTIVVYAGDLVHVDGVVVRGRALVDQQVLTGESRPVLKHPGDPVYASTVLTDGKIFVHTERVGVDTRAQRIVQVLEGAPVHDTRMGDQARRFADRLVVPTLLLGAGTYALTGNAARAAAVFIFDFATGIRVSAPTTVLASMAAGVRRDILIKGGRALERLATMDTLVFDKTGTLTTGRPTVTDVRPFADGMTAGEVLALAAAAERGIRHPAASAIVRAAQTRGLTVSERADAQAEIGWGVRAEVDGRHVLVGSARYLAREGVPLPPTARQQTAEAERHEVSLVFVARDGEALGAVAYTDPPRPEARAVLDALRARGVRELWMVTGDNPAVAAAIGRELGIVNVEAEVFPERKAELVQELRRAGHVVGMIGDGINDSPALAHADVSFSLKDGTDIARETADVVLHGSLHGLPDAIDIARTSARLMRQNLGLVAVPNALGLALAAAGLLGPAAATALNNGAAIAAAANGLRPLL